MSIKQYHWFRHTAEVNYFDGPASTFWIDGYSGNLDEVIVKAHTNHSNKKSLRLEYIGKFSEQETDIKFQ